MLPIITRHWWVLVLRGVIALLFGITALIHPPVTFLFLAIFIAAYLVLDGLFALFAGIRAAESHRRWWPFLLEGVADLVAGAVVYMRPDVLIALLAAWAIITGLMLLAPAFALPSGAGRWFLALNVAISIVLGFVIALHPGAGVVFIVWSVAFYALSFGAVTIALGFRVRSLQ